MRKRLLSYCLAFFIMLTSVIPANAEIKTAPITNVIAEGYVYNDGYTQEVVDLSFANSIRMYGTRYGDADYNEEFDINEVDISEIVPLVTEQDAVNYIMEQLKAHNGKIVFTVDTYTPDVDNDTICKAAKNMMLKALTDIKKYNGVSTEGNYFYGAFGTTCYKAFRQDSRIIFVILQNYRTTLEQEAALTAEINALKKEIGTDRSYTDEVSVILPLYKWIYDNITYDEEAYEKHLSGEKNYYDTSYTAYAAGVEHKAVCLGIAAFTYRYLTEMGVECRIVRNGTHAWNAVKVRGKWYETDMTWDLEGLERNPKYFLLSHKNMNKAQYHEWNEETQKSDDLASLPWASVNYMNVLNLMMTGLEDAITYTKKNLGFQTVKVTDQDGNLLKEGVDYNLTYYYNSKQEVVYQATSTDDNKVSTSSSYKVNLATPKITKIERFTKTTKNGHVYECFKVTYDKVPGATKYYLHGTYQHIINSGGFSHSYTYSTKNYCFTKWFHAGDSSSKYKEFQAKKYAALFEVIAEREFEVEQTIRGQSFKVPYRFKSKATEAKIKENASKVSKPKNKKSRMDIPVGVNTKGEKKLSTKNLW